uniref:Uncharacterized protein n=2 Tax=Caenorhabditis japonica TaxID=281687 RepID=A0A8R1EUX0_CAEJA
MTEISIYRVKFTSFTRIVCLLLLFNWRFCCAFPSDSKRIVREGKLSPKLAATVTSLSQSPHAKPQVLSNFVNHKSSNINPNAHKALRRLVEYSLGHPFRTVHYIITGFLVVQVIAGILITIVGIKRKRKRKQEMEAKEEEAKKKIMAKAKNARPDKSVSVVAPKTVAPSTKGEVSVAQSSMENSGNLEGSMSDALEEKFSLEDCLPPTDRDGRKSTENAETIAKVRAYVKKTLEQQKSDTSSSKFKKKGHIYMPLEPSIDPPPPLPKNIILEKVWYDPTQNEMYDIGTDVDSIEMEPSMSFGTLTTEEQTVKNKKAPNVVKNNSADKTGAKSSITTTSKLSTKSAEGPTQSSLQKDEIQI